MSLFAPTSTDPRYYFNSATRAARLSEESTKAPTQPFDILFAFFFNQSLFAWAAPQTGL